MADKMNRKITETIFQKHCIDFFIVNLVGLKACLAPDLASGRRAPEFELYSADGLHHVFGRA
jgi:hypothetical protein